QTPNTFTQSVNSLSASVVLNFAASNQFVQTLSSTFPVPQVTTAVKVPLSTINSWKYYSVPFTYTNTGNGNILYIGTDGPATMVNYLAASGGYLGQDLIYTLIDDISIKPVAQAVTFNLPNNYLCPAQGYTDLAQYTSVPGGTFTASAGITTV